MGNSVRLTFGATLIAGFVSLSFVPALAQQTAKACDEQWKSNKVSIHRPDDLTSAIDPTTLLNKRTPAFDLDSVYGNGPTASPSCTRPTAST